jgi:UDP-3-O-[3-hydroxymyristoyl] glucosamine N-acyltransferase
MKIVFVGCNHNIQQMTDICHGQGLTVVGILDHDYWNNTEQIGSVPVIGSEQQWNWSNEYAYFIATNWIPGNDTVHQRNQLKRINQINLLQKQKIQCVNLIHPTAVVPNTCTLGQGIMIGANSVLGNHCQIGDYCQIREQSYLAHSATLSTNVVLQVQSYIGAGVVIHDHSYIGIKSSIIPKSTDQLSIPANTFVKSHSLITSTPG